MKKIYLLFFISLLFTRINAQVTFAWANNFGGNASANTKVRSAVDPAGNVFVTGIFEGTKSFGSFTLTAGGIADTYIAKFDATGTCIWARGIGGSGTTQGNNIAVDALGYVYITGTFTNTLFYDSFYFITSGNKDAFLAKFDGANGNSVWCNKIGGQVEDSGEGLTIDNDANVYVSGSWAFRIFFTPTDSLDNGSASYSDAFLAKYDSAGVFSWAKKIGGANNDQGLSVAYSSNYIFASGSFIGLNCQFGNGITLSSPGTSSDAFIAKYDLSGTCLWARKGGGAGNEAATSVCADINGYPTITGFFASNATFGSISLSTGNTGEMFVVHYDPNGTSLWGKQGGGSNDDSGFGIACDSFGYVVVTGAFQGNASFTSVGGSPISVTASGQSDGFISKYTPWGQLQFVLKVSGAGVDNAMSTSFASSNNYYITGNFTGTATLGSFTLTATGGNQQSFLTYVPGFSTGIDQNILPEMFTYYPNPADGLITLSNLETGSEISVYNNAGQVVYNAKTTSENFEINTKAWLNGFYYLKVSNNTAIKTQKVVVAH